MRKKSAILLAGITAAAMLLSGCGTEKAVESSDQNTVSSQQEPENTGNFENTEDSENTGNSENTTEDTGNTGNSENAAEDTEKEKAFTGIGPCQIGDTVVFGSYEQDNDTGNGKEAIEWIVLDMDGQNALLLSKYGLDAQAYSDSGEAVTWENCALRQWLNDTFYKEAFSEAEQGAVVPVTNTNPDNERWGTAGGNDTLDSVFLLSIEEAEFYFSDRNEELWIQATPYAVEQGAFVADNGNSPWWLRSPGDNNEGGFCAAYVDYPPTGVVLSGYDAQRNSRAVRPALWVTI